MNHFAGLDASVKEMSLLHCRRRSKIVREKRMATRRAAGGADTSCVYRKPHPDLFS